MFKKMDCVKIRVADPEAAAAYYTATFGLRPLWRFRAAASARGPRA